MLCCLRQNGNTLSRNWYHINCCGSIITIIRTIKHFNFVENIFNIRKTDVSTLHFGAYLIFESFWTYIHIFQFHFRISETNRNVTFIQLETNRNITFIQSNYFKCTSTIYSLISPWYKLEVLVKLKYDVALRSAWKKLIYIDYAMKILARYEPGSTAWRATMLTITPATLVVSLGPFLKLISLYCRFCPFKYWLDIQTNDHAYYNRSVSSVGRALV